MMPCQNGHSQNKSLNAHLVEVRAGLGSKGTQRGECALEGIAQSLYLF